MKFILLAVFGLLAHTAGSNTFRFFESLKEFKCCENVCCYTSLRLKPETRRYSFVGRFKSASVLAGSGHYIFVGLNGKEKDFAHDVEWLDQDLPYDFLDEGNANDSYIDEWFKITYHGVYGVLSGDHGAPERWHRKIDTIKMAPIPPSPDVVKVDTATLANFDVVDGIAQFGFRAGTANYFEFDCHVNQLKQFEFDFSDKESILERFYDQQFKITYRLEYVLETDVPVTRRILSLKLL